MPAPTDSSADDLSFDWENATQANQYRVAKVGATQDGCDLATANTDVPLGVIQNNPKQGEAALIRGPLGKLSWVEASAAISVGARLAATTGGKAVTYTRAGSWTSTATYTFGTAISAATADTQYICAQLWFSEGQD